MSSLVTVCPQDLSETEITPVVPFCIEDAMESPPLTPATPEAILFNQQVPRTKKLLQGGLEELQQVGLHHHHRCHHI